MKNLKYVLAFILAFFMFGNVISAASNLPEAVTTDSWYEIEYIENYPIIRKSADNKHYDVYCINQTATYGGGITFSKTGVVDPGFKYIINNRPKTADKEKDFYITQMAVWYYEDYLNQNNANLESQVKKYIILHSGYQEGYEEYKEEVSSKIYALYNGAKRYVEAVSNLEFGKDDVVFTKKGDYYVSNEIIVDKQNVGNIEYELANAPAGTIVESSKNGVIVKVPTASVKETVEFSLNATAKYTTEDAYYYYNSAKYQRLLFQDVLSTVKTLEATKPMKIEFVEEKPFDVKISKTDITKSKEVPGATLVVKDETGKEIEKWVSSKEAHNIKLYPGKYTLTETIAPKGYKLSTTTIHFMVSTNGSVYVKENGNYVAVSKVVMVNELIDVVAINKVDSKTKKLVAGAKLVIKDDHGKTIKTFTSTDKTYYIELDPGYYTIQELKAPKDYVLSNKVIYFYLSQDGTLKIKNEKGKYVESALITFENTKKVKKVVKVPATGLNSYTTLIGIALLASGIICVKKINKEC